MRGCLSLQTETLPPPVGYRFDQTRQALTVSGRGVENWDFEPGHANPGGLDCMGRLRLGQSLSVGVPVRSWEVWGEGEEVRLGRGQWSDTQSHR